MTVAFPQKCLPLLPLLALVLMTLTVPSAAKICFGFTNSFARARRPQRRPLRPPRRRPSPPLPSSPPLGGARRAPMPRRLRYRIPQHPPPRARVLTIACCSSLRQWWPFLQPLPLLLPPNSSNSKRPRFHFPLPRLHTRRRCLHRSASAEGTRRTGLAGATGAGD